MWFANEEEEEVMSNVLYMYTTDSTISTSVLPDQIWEKNKKEWFCSLKRVTSAKKRFKKKEFFNISCNEMNFKNVLTVINVMFVHIKIQPGG